MICRTNRRFQTRWMMKCKLIGTIKGRHDEAIQQKPFLLLQKGLVRTPNTLPLPDVTKYYCYSATADPDNRRDLCYTLSDSEIPALKSHKTVNSSNEEGEMSGLRKEILELQHYPKFSSFARELPLFERLKVLYRKEVNSFTKCQIFERFMLESMAAFGH